MVRSLFVLAALASCQKCGRDAGPKAPLIIDSGTAGPVVPPPEPGVTPAVQLLREADAALQGGRIDEAIDKATQALKAQPTHPVANNVLGRASVQKFLATKDAADAQRAEAAFRRAFEADPSFWPALQNLGELAEKQGKLDEAAGWYAKVLAAQPDHPEKQRWLSLADAGR